MILLKSILLKNFWIFVILIRWTLYADGMVYIIARKNERTAEDLFGWREVKNSEVTYSTHKGDESLKIFSKKAKAGKEIEIPQTKDFCGITPIAKKIDYRITEPRS